MFVIVVFDVFIVVVKRIVFGIFGGKFVKIFLIDFMIYVLKVVLEVGKVNLEVVNFVVIGNVI